MDNKVSIDITGKDDTGTAWASVEAKSKAFQALMDQTTRKEIAAHQAVSNAESQHLKTAKLLADTEEVLSMKMDKTGTEAETAASKFGLLAGAGGGGGMAALIAGGVALSPVLTALGVGFGGLGLAALSVIKNQKLMAQTLAPLKTDYQAFVKALQPTILKDFNAAITAARPLLRAIEPVAKATGDALAQVLGQIGAEFRSGEFQHFFSFLAATAGPDLRLVGQDFVDLTRTLPPLIESLQPVAVAMLKVTDGAAKLTSAAESGTKATFHAARGVDSWTQSLTNHIPGARAVNDSISWWQQHIQGYFSGTEQAATATRHLGQSAMTTATAVKNLTTALQGQISALLTAQGNQVTWRQAQQAATQAIKANTGSLDSNKASALTARQAIIQSTGAAIAYANSQVMLHHNVKAASQIINDQIAYLQQHAGHSQFAAQEVLALVTSESKLPKSVTSKIRVDTTTAAYAIAGIQRQLSILNGEVVTTYVSTQFVAPVSGAQGKIRRASGGITGAAGGGARSGLTWVGEHGPELVSLPAGSMVHSNPDSQRMAAAGGGTGRVVLEFSRAGSSDFEKFMITAIQKWVRVRGGGNVQVAFGDAT